MPRGHVTFGGPGSFLKEESRRVLAYVRANPGCTRQAVRAALPSIKVDAKLNGLQTLGVLFGERETGQPLLRFYPLVKPERVEGVKLRGPADGPIGARRERDLYAPWPEPYLPDVGVRRDGLQYRDCPSRRGAELVYCWRRQS